MLGRSLAFFWLTISEAEIFEQASLERRDAADSSDAIYIYRYRYRYTYLDRHKI